MSTAVDLSLEENIKALANLVKEQSRQATTPVLTCSFQAEDMVVLHAVKDVIPDIPVLFLDTGYHFDEVYHYREEMVKAWNLKLINIQPAQSVAEQEAEFGILYQSAPDRCCGLRKVQPLFTSLEPYDLWFTGLRREQSKSRAELQVIDTFKLPSGKVIEKISPLAFWSTRDVWHYASHFDIPVLPLYDKGYSSIGCRPCTSLPSDPNDPRSGRWSGQKLECGIHIQPA